MLASAPQICRRGDRATAAGKYGALEHVAARSALLVLESACVAVAPTALYLMAGLPFGCCAFVYALGALLAFACGCCIEALAAWAHSPPPADARGGGGGDFAPDSAPAPRRDRVACGAFGAPCMVLSTGFGVELNDFRRGNPFFWHARANHLRWYVQGVALRVASVVAVPRRRRRRRRWRLAALRRRRLALGAAGAGRGGAARVLLLPDAPAAVRARVGEEAGGVGGDQSFADDAAEALDAAAKNPLGLARDKGAVAVPPRVAPERSNERSRCGGFLSLSRETVALALGLAHGRAVDASARAEDAGAEPLAGYRARTPEARSRRRRRRRGRQRGSASSSTSRASPGRPSSAPSPTAAAATSRRRSTGAAWRSRASFGRAVVVLVGDLTRRSPACGARDACAPRDAAALARTYAHLAQLGCTVVATAPARRGAVLAFDRVALLRGPRLAYDGPPRPVFDALASAATRPGLADAARVSRDATPAARGSCSGAIWRAADSGMLGAAIGAPLANAALLCGAFWGQGHDDARSVLWLNYCLLAASATRPRRAARPRRRFYADARRFVGYSHGTTADGALLSGVVYGPVVLTAVALLGLFRLLSSGTGPSLSLSF
ncbi:ATPase [Aureococcus anophagefferens]|nr:ATPase [Aureococcus anophagefferens]